MRKTKQQGFTLLEVSVSLILLTAVISGAVGMLRSLARHERQTNRQLAAAREARNIAERILAAPFDELPALLESPPALSPIAKEMLANGEVSIELQSNEDDSLSQYRIGVALRWLGEAGQPRIVRLALWRHENRGQNR